MPSSKFVIKTKVPESFRVNKVKGMFDCDFQEIVKEFDVNIPIEDKEWNVGLIVGSSGTGKSTIIREMFKDYNVFESFEWKSESIIDDFDKNFTPKQITEILSKVGFASPPDWLKPYSVLSNGQKMRADLARLVLECDEKPFIYDEFTSVVDRTVAKIGSYAISKFIKKENKKFIAVTCHHDVKEWLEPCWIYDTDKMEFSFTRGSLRRPKIEVVIRKAEQREWSQFKDFHYLSHGHNVSAHKYIAEINGHPVGWCSVLHFPHPIIKNMKRIHRVVIKPDYQGIGLGTRLITEVAKMYKPSRVRLVTSSPAFIASLYKSKDWLMVRKPGRVINSNDGDCAHLKNSSSKGRLTAGFEYIGDKNGRY